MSCGPKTFVGIADVKLQPNSSLYALRVNPTAREVLGDEIYFKHQIPWIWGSIDQLHGRIDVEFSVKGTGGWGVMRFKSVRKRRTGCHP